MSRINTNITAMIGGRVLNNNITALNKSLQKLSTGLRINTASDDPSGLIASENLRKQMRGTETAIKNAERANTIVNTAEGALVEVSSMLLDVQSLLSEVANKGGMSAEEIDANQSQVDSIINSIDRIANTTEFAGIKLLDGNLDYTTSGVSATNILEVNVRSAKLIDGAEMSVDVAITNSAETGHMFMSGAGLSSSGSLTIQIGSNRGTTELTFAQSSTIAMMASAINAVKEITGVSAFISGTTASVDSIDFGTDAYVSIETLGNDDYENMNNGVAAGMHIMNTTAGTDIGDRGALKDVGANIEATVNGATATGNGKTLSVRTAVLDVEIDLSVITALSQSTGADMVFTITGGGSDFSLGSEVNGLGLEPLGIQSVVTSRLGNATDGFLNSLKSGGTNSLKSTNLVTAQNILNSAVKDITGSRGRLGNFSKNTLETTMNVLKITNENLAAAESAIRDTDFAAESSNMTRNQILVQSSTSILGQANFAPQSVLSLLGYL
jgi:flagellin